MKFVKTLVVAALLSFATVVTAQEDDDAGRTYESIEKERFIYGKKGDEGYGEPKTAAELMELE